MIKKFAAGLAAALCSTVLWAASVEGADYVVLDTPVANASGTLIKVYSYDCFFCYRYDQRVMPALIEKLSGEMKLVDYHLHTKGKYGREASDILAVLWVADIEAKRDPWNKDSLYHKAKFALFTAYHDRKERWAAGAEAFMMTALEAAGMSRTEFEKRLKTDEVQALVKAWSETTYDIARVQGIPAFVVNGKYLVKTASVRSVEGLIAAIRELAAKK